MSSNYTDQLCEKSTTGTSPVLSNEQTCHILPCNIDYQGMTPSHLFFRPVESFGGCYSSTLRGRGLVAVKEEERNKSNIALVSCQDKTLSVKASIENIFEWHHAHDPEAIQCDGLKSRVSVAHEWLEVSHAVHDPIPVDN